MCRRRASRVVTRASSAAAASLASTSSARAAAAAAKAPFAVSRRRSRSAAAASIADFTAVRVAACTAARTSTGGWKTFDAPAGRAAGNEAVAAAAKDVGGGGDGGGGGGYPGGGYPGGGRGGAALGFSSIPSRHPSRHLLLGPTRPEAAGGLLVRRPIRPATRSFAGSGEVRRVTPRVSSNRQRRLREANRRRRGDGRRRRRMRKTRRVRRRRWRPWVSPCRRRRTSRCRRGGARARTRARAMPTVRLLGGGAPRVRPRAREARRFARARAARRCAGAGRRSPPPRDFASATSVAAVTTAGPRGTSPVVAGPEGAAASGTSPRNPRLAGMKTPRAPADFFTASSRRMACFARRCSWSVARGSGSTARGIGRARARVRVPPEARCEPRPHARVRFSTVHDSRAEVRV